LPLYTWKGASAWCARAPRVLPARLAHARASHAHAKGKPPTWPLPPSVRATHMPQHVQHVLSVQEPIVPPAAPEGVGILTSRCGGATLESVMCCSREQSKELNDVGFTWCAADKVLLRLQIDNSATTSVADLLAVDALRASYTNGECVLSKRAFLQHFLFIAVNQVCKANGFSFSKDVGWVKAMDADEWCALKSIAGTCSEEVAERRRVQADKDIEIEKQWDARERAATIKKLKFEARKHKDPTYQRRHFEYGQLLLQMWETGSYVLGSDGAPNWPEPPVPFEKGIVSKATEHLVPPRPQPM